MILSIRFDSTHASCSHGLRPCPQILNLVLIIKLSTLQKWKILITRWTVSRRDGFYTATTSMRSRSRGGTRSLHFNGGMQKISKAVSVCSMSSTRSIRSDRFLATSLKTCVSTRSLRRRREHDAQLDDGGVVMANANASRICHLLDIYDRHHGDEMNEEKGTRCNELMCLEST
jgi:hypothetical protein